MKRKYVLVLALWLPFLMVGCSQKRPGETRVLVFTKTEGFHHASISDGVKAIQKMGKERHFLVDTTSDSRYFTEDSLKKYSAVIFLSPTGDVLNNYQQADFERYIQAGGGYVGIHAASDCEYHWPWYGKLVGAYFKSHPKQQEAKLHIHKDKNFPITDSLPDPWIRKDEWYNFKEPPKDVHVLISIDESSYEGGSNGQNHPMTWYHDYDGGRAFYTALGHTPESYTDPKFLELLWEGIDYAIGKNEVLNYKKATALRVPDEDRFSKTFLAGGLDEPTELTILPDLNILIGERKGGLKFFNQKDHSIQKVAQLDVYHHTLHTEGVNVEMGLMGLQADPRYDQNHWVYVYYSPVDTSVDRLSRFKFQDGKFDLNSEQTILEVHTRREICCHTGGSIAFDADDNLYLSVGDNTTPFDEKNPKTGKAYPINLHGFAPLDDRPGFEHYDDRRAAGNSNDLRGKILRIHVKEDGTYSIPKGNLFPEGAPNTRPEIYVMGDRNPYRISVDKHTGYVYWGEVGPDANHDSLETRGPRGYDEFNQARKAGNFGWPYFVGDNYAYHEYNYATGVSGPAFDPQNVVNRSRNNTGIKDLPPAQPAFIWYPYAESPDFPILGKGGRCAMGGPVYYVKDYPDSAAFPEYYNGKLFIYDWIRNWIMAVTMNPDGDLQTIEPFMPHTSFHNISDMELGPDGKMYIVEYGEGWFSKNPDAALSVISFNSGNRPPIAQLKVDRTSGTLPLKINVSASGSMDPDGDKIEYSVNFGDGTTTHSDSAHFKHTYQKAGVFPVSVTVNDGKGGKSRSENVRIYAGNSIPKVTLQTSDNTSFYFPNRPLHYKVSVSDKEDSQINSDAVFVEANYMESPDKAALASGLAAPLSGKSIMESLDCQSCHKVDEKSIGPSFRQVALRYRDDLSKAMDLLPKKIINGGSGNWGETAMAAHPGLSASDAKSIVSWIMSLSKEPHKKASMPLEGSFIPGKKFTLNDQGALVLSATYTDNGNGKVPALTGSGDLVLFAPVLEAANAKTSSGVSGMDYNGQPIKVINGDQAWLQFPKLSLTGLSSVEVYFGTQDTSKEGWNMEVRQDRPEGPLLGSGVIGKNTKPMEIAHAAVEITPGQDHQLHDLYFVFKKKDGNEEGALGISRIQVKE